MPQTKRYRINLQQKDTNDSKVTIYKTPQIQTKSRQINKNMVQRMTSLMQKQGVKTRSGEASEGQSNTLRVYDSMVDKTSKVSDRDLYSSAIIDKKQKLNLNENASKYTSEKKSNVSLDDVSDDRIRNASESNVSLMNFMKKS